MKISVQIIAQDLNISLAAFEKETISQLNGAIESIAYAAMGEWKRLAGSRLRTALNIYLQGLNRVDSFSKTKSENINTFTLFLIGGLANDFEFGKSSWDMKPALLSGPHAKVSEKTGVRYNTVPFRHGPESRAFAYTGKAREQKLYDHFKVAMKLLKKQEYTRERFELTASGMVKKRTLIPSAPVHPYLAGLRHTQVINPKTGKAGHGTKMTWRRISDNSDPSSWLHPGLKALNIHKEVHAYAEREIKNIIKTVLG